MLYTGITTGSIGFDFVDTSVGFQSAWNVLLSTSDETRPSLRSIDVNRPVAGYSNMSDYIILDQDRLRFERSPLRGLLEEPLDSSSFPTYMQTMLSDSDEDNEAGESDQEDALAKANHHPLLARQLSQRDVSAPSEKRDSTLQTREIDSTIAMSSYFDISSTMYRRSKQGYGLNPHVNKTLALSDPLKTIWTWLSWTSSAIKEGTLRTSCFDFAFEGCLNIWNGTGGSTRKNSNPKYEQFLEAVVRVNENFDSDIFPESITAAPLRQLALVSTGWCMTTAEFVNFRDKLIETGDFAKAAFYSVAQNRDISKAIDIMSSSGVAMDEAVSEFQDARGNEKAARSWREKWPDLGIDLDSPYIRAIFAYLVANDWRDVIDEQGLSLRERLSLTLRYIRDEEVGSILQDLCRTEVSEGNLEGLLLTGVRSASLDLLQAYVDRTSDVQTAALIITLTPDLCSDRRAMHWIYDYRMLLMNSGLQIERCRFDVQRTRLSRHANRLRTSVKQVSLRCNHCNTVIDFLEAPQEAHESKQYTTRLSSTPRYNTACKSTLCANCRKALPKCILCLLPVGLENLISVCLACNHTLHHGHAQQWFSKQVKCPAPQCSCQCRRKNHVNT